MEALRVSAVIPVYNGGADLQKCMTALAASDYPLHEIILVDDASTDGMTESIAERHGARVLMLQEQGGPARARNLGVEAASGDLIFFVDADVLVHTDTLGIGVGKLQAEATTVAVFGSYDDEPGHPSFLSQYRNLFHHWVHQTSHSEASTFWTGCGLIRRSVFLEMGGFKTTYGTPSIEDIELGARIHRAGQKIRLEKTMLCKHLKQWTFWNMVKTDVFLRGIPWVVLLLSHPNAPKDLNLSFRSRLATLLAGILALVALILPLTGHAKSLGPAAAFLLVTAGCTWLIGTKAGNSFFTLSLAIIAPLAVFFLQPDALALLPLALVLILVWTHLDFYRYVAHNRDAAFAWAVIPAHVIFFLGCAVSGGLGILRHLFATKES